MAAPTPLEILSALARLLPERERLDREEAARDQIRRLRSRFTDDYRAMAAELRCRGGAPSQTENEYVERRFAEALGETR